MTARACSIEDWSARTLVASPADMATRLNASKSGSRWTGVSPAAWAARNWAATTSITAPEFLTRGAIAGARSALLTPAQARARGSLMPHAEVAIVPGSHGGFNRIDELNDRIAAFIQAHATGRQAAADSG